MDVKTLQEIPPWEWPRDAGKTIQEILIDYQADESDRVIAADLAGNIVVINDELADSLLTIIRSPDEPEQLRSTAAIALGPVLELADTDGFSRRHTHYRAHISGHSGLAREALFRRQHSQASPAANSGGIGARSRELARGRDKDSVFQRRPRLGADGCVFDALGSRF
jgi:hypothetical protein